MHFRFDALTNNIRNNKNSELENQYSQANLLRGQPITDYDDLVNERTGLKKQFAVPEDIEYYKTP